MLKAVQCQWQNVYTVYQYVSYMPSVIYNYDILSRDNGNTKMCIPIHKQQLDKKVSSHLSNFWKSGFPIYPTFIFVPVWLFI